MKTLNLLFFSITILLFTSMNSNSQELTGNGNVTKEIRSISSFDKLELNSVMNVFIKQSEIESVTVETDNNLLPFIKTYVKDNILVIETKSDYEIKESAKLNVYISFKNLVKLENNGIGNVKSENQLNLLSLTIENNSVGNLDLDLNCEKLKAELNSVGNVDFTGKAKNADIENNGVGNLNAFDLAADIMKLESNAVGNSEINANNELYLDLNGVGNVSYKGGAVIKSLNINGVGKVKKM